VREVLEVSKVPKTPWGPTLRELLFHPSTSRATPNQDAPAGQGRTGFSTRVAIGSSWGKNGYAAFTTPCATASRSTALIRVCHPGPVALKASSTSASTRMIKATSDSCLLPVGRHGGGVVRVIRPGLVVNGHISGSFTLDALPIRAGGLSASFWHTASLSGSKVSLITAFIVLASIHQFINSSIHQVNQPLRAVCRAPRQHQKSPRLAPECALQSFQGMASRRPQNAGGSLQRLHLACAPSLEQ
jgi:hypothetical protein